MLHPFLYMALKLTFTTYKIFVDGPNMSDVGAGSLAQAVVFVAHRFLGSVCLKGISEKSSWHARGLKDRGKAICLFWDLLIEWGDLDVGTWVAVYPSRPTRLLHVPLVSLYGPQTCLCSRGIRLYASSGWTLEV